MANPPPDPQAVIITKGWQWFRRNLSQTLPTQLLRAHTIRRGAVADLGRKRR